VVINSRSHHSKSVVLVGEVEQALALDIGICDVDTIEDGWVVVKDAKEVVVVAQKVLVCLRQLRCRWWVVGGETEIGNRAEETARGRRIGH
jgi:hypothetical protein